jgi:NAD(P)H dehydrogenase (quinone)
MAVKLAIIQYSDTSATYDMAKIMEAAAAEAGADVRLRRIEEIAPQDVIQQDEAWQQQMERISHIPQANHADLEWADAVLFGAPARYGLPAAPLIQFLETVVPADTDSTLSDTFVSAFLTAPEVTGTETAMNALHNTLYHRHTMIVPPCYPDDAHNQPVHGDIFIIHRDDEPDDATIDAAKSYAVRLVEIAHQFRQGAKAMPRTN